MNTEATAGRALSTIAIDANEDQKPVVGDTRRNLVQQLVTLGAPATRVPSMPIDVAWSSGGQPCMFDLKTPEDFIASSQDGRLHYQMESMQRADCMVYGFVIEGRWGNDGVTIGHGPHAWSWNRFDDLVLSVQCEGACIVHVADAARTASRLYDLYKWTGKAAHGSWHRPAKSSPVLREKYADRSYRKHVESLMNLLPDMGEKRANMLLDTYAFMDILGITEDGLAEAAVRWQAVRGIGPKVVGVWDSYLREDFSSAIIRAETIKHAS